MNFKDPIGLLRRMLTSGNRAALWSLAQLAMEKAAKPIDFAIATSQQSRRRKEIPAEWPIILMTGPPRAGTTMASQLLARYLEVSYFTNACAILPHASVLAARLCTGNFKPPRQAATCNFYGQTYGLAGINDGFIFWNRWLGANRYRVDDDVTPQSLAEMRQFFADWGKAFRRPILNKNNRNVDAIDLLSDALPNAYFIIVERDPVLIVQSLLKARKFVQGSEDIGWGLFSLDRSEDARKFANLDAICQQVASIQQRLDDQLGRLAASRYHRVDYADVCQAPVDFVCDVGRLIPGVQVRAELLRQEAPQLMLSSNVTLGEDEHRYVQQRLAELRPSTMPAERQS